MGSPIRVYIGPSLPGLLPAKDNAQPAGAHAGSYIAPPPCMGEEALQAHPDRAFARYICDGLRHGFRIGFERGAPLRSARANM